MTASPFDDIRKLAADAPAVPTSTFAGGDRLAEISAWLNGASTGAAVNTSN